MVDAVTGSAPDGDHPAAGLTDLDAAAEGAEDADRGNPALGGRDRSLIYTFRPLSDERRARPPHVADAVPCRALCGSRLWFLPDGLRGGHLGAFERASTFFSIRWIAPIAMLRL